MGDMIGKVKDLLSFLWNSWRDGTNGKIGVLCILFSILIFGRLLFGEVSLHRLIGNRWHLQDEIVQMNTEREKLEALEKHIQLIQTRSPDYVEEIAGKHLNIGSPKVKILR